MRVAYMHVTPIEKIITKKKKKVRENRVMPDSIIFLSTHVKVGTATHRLRCVQQVQLP